MVAESEAFDFLDAPDRAAWRCRNADPVHPGPRKGRRFRKFPTSSRRLRNLVEGTTLVPCRSRSFFPRSTWTWRRDRFHAGISRMAIGGQEGRRRSSRSRPTRPPWKSKPRKPHFRNSHRGRKGSDIPVGEAVAWIYAEGEKPAAQLIRRTDETLKLLRRALAGKPAPVIPSTAPVITNVSAAGAPHQPHRCASPGSEAGYSRLSSPAGPTWPNGRGPMWRLLLRHAQAQPSLLRSRSQVLPADFRGERYDRC